MRVRVILTAIFIILLGVIASSYKRIHTLTMERDKYKGNAEALLDGAERYKVNDSLNAMQIKALTMSLAEYKQRNPQDAEIVKQMTKGRSISSVGKTSTQSTYNINAKLKDTIIVNKYNIDTIRCVNILDKWYTLQGCIYNDSLRGVFINYDSLLITCSVKYKRFLGFLWKTKKVKDKRIDVISRNPHSMIEDVNFVFID